MTRRELSLLALAPWAASGRDRSYSNDHPDMLLRYLTGQLNDWHSRWDVERGKLSTPEAILARNRQVREKMREMIHGLPERNPLQPVVTNTLQRSAYRVENVMFQSRPDFWVTANLYVPAGTGPFPGIISPCGHYGEAKAYPEYQAAYLNLVKAGFVVLAYDPVGQGERRQYWNPTTGETEVGNATTEHSMAGQVLLMMGENLTHYRIWDGMRAIDYLLTRREVDASRIGCAGHSGGGTLTQFISALDERVKVAVINEGGTGHRWPIELRPENRIGPSDVEQNIFPAAIHGVDLCDIHTAIAPRPLLCLIEDFNSRFNLAAEHVQRRYRQLGVAEKFATEEATDPHAWTPKLRIATTRWFSRWFLGKPGPDREPEYELEPPSRLYCLPNGSIHYSRKGETVLTLMAKKAASLPSRGIGELPRLIGYRKPDSPLDARKLVTTQRRGYQIDKVEFLAEPGIHLPAWVFVPEQPKEGMLPLVYVHESGKQSDGLEFGPLEEMCKRGELVVAVDVRGIGETRPPHPPSSDRSSEYGFLFDTETAMAYMAWYMDRSLFGMRVQDVVRTVDYTIDRTGARGVRMYGRGMGALWTLFAGALDTRIQSLICERGLVSYRSIAATDRYKHGANVFIRDVLLHFDLPDVAAALAGRELTLRNPVDPMKHAVPIDAANRTYQKAREAFAKAGAAGRFRVERT